MRTIYIVLALCSVCFFAASSCSDDYTGTCATSTTDNNVAYWNSGNARSARSTGTAGGGATMNCLDCLSEIPGTCGDETAACNADPECAAWAMFFQQCFLNEGMGSPTALVHW